MDFGRQVGRQNGPKIDSKKHGKKHAKKDQFFNALGGGVPRTRHPGGWIARPPKSRFFKTDQTPLELGKCLGLGKGKGLGTDKHRHKGKGKDTGQVGKNTHSRRRAKRGGGLVV